MKHVQRLKMLDKGVSIIGGGPVGLTLAIALRQHNIACKVFERNPGGSVLGGSISLAPNALRILQYLGLYEEVKAQGFPLQHTWLKKPDCGLAGRFFYGHKEAYGFDAIRIERKKLMKILNYKADESGIQIVAKTFSSAKKEASGVMSRFTDGSTDESSLLVGADGIHSAVRSVIPGNNKSDPSYTGFLAVNTSVDTPSFPSSYRLPCLQLTRAGGIIAGPDDASGRRIFVATQFAIPDRTRQEWDSLRNDTASLRELFKSKIPHCPPEIQDLLGRINEDSKITFWPFYVIPPLDAWKTADGDISIIGDAAHAIPPTIGQGIAQGLEDSFLLAQALSGVSHDITLAKAMHLWQTVRQDRIRKISNLSTLMGTRLLPPHVQATLELQPEEREELNRMWKTTSSEAEADRAKPQDPSALSWLYKADLEREMEEKWLDSFGLPLR